MADIKLVIKIPEEMYQNVLNGTYCGTLYEELKNGIPLPKGHGRLIDGDELESRMKIGYYIVRAAPTIIEADNGESEVQE